MPTRRQFLETAIRAMPALETPNGPRAVATGESGAAFSPMWRADLQDRARTAPRARYWVSGATLAPVLRSIVQIRKSGTHLEVVNLVVLTLNDRDESLRKLADWVMGELGPDVPLHFTRFHPDYQLLNLPPTPVATLEHARAIAMHRGLRYVYVGNVPGHPGNHTYCPQCRAVVIRRDGFFVSEIQMKKGACAACGARIAGVWA